MRKVKITKVWVVLDNVIILSLYAVPYVAIGTYFICLKMYRGEKASDH